MDVVIMWFLTLLGGSTSLYRACCPCDNLYLLVWLKVWKVGWLRFGTLSNVVETKSMRNNISDDKNIFRFIETNKNTNLSQSEQIDALLFCSVCWGYPFHMRQPCEWAECLTEASQREVRVWPLTKVTRSRELICCAAVEWGQWKKDSTLEDRWLSFCAQKTNGISVRALVHFVFVGKASLSDPLGLVIFHDWNLPGFVLLTTVLVCSWLSADFFILDKEIHLISKDFVVLHHTAVFFQVTIWL